MCVTLRDHRGGANRVRAAARGQSLDWQGGRSYLGRGPMARHGLHVHSLWINRRGRGGAVAEGRCVRAVLRPLSWRLKGGGETARRALDSFSASPRRLRTLNRAKRRGAAFLPPVCLVLLQERPSSCPSGERAVGVRPVLDRPDPAVTPVLSFYELCNPTWSGACFYNPPVVIRYLLDMQRCPLVGPSSMA